jgi:hypothetical protein
LNNSLFCPDFQAMTAVEVQGFKNDATGFVQQFDLIFSERQCPTADVIKIIYREITALCARVALASASVDPDLLAASIFMLSAWNNPPTGTHWDRIFRAAQDALRRYAQ